MRGASNFAHRSSRSGFDSSSEGYDQHFRQSRSMSACDDVGSRGGVLPAMNSEMLGAQGSDRRSTSPSGVAARKGRGVDVVPAL